MVSILIIFSSCVTSNQQGVTELGGLSVDYNEFEKQDWIQFKSVELYQDSDSIYVDVAYKSSESGSSFFFNPPNGDVFKVKGVFNAVETQLVEKIKKDDFTRIEDITCLFSKEDDSERAGIFFSIQSIDIDDLPPVTESQLARVAIKGSGQEEESSQEASAFVVKLDDLDMTLLEKMPPHQIEERSYMWRGRKVVGDFVVSDNIEKVQAFVDNFDPIKTYELEDIYKQIGVPLYYEQGNDIYFSKNDLGDSYSLVYAASSELTSCLSINIWENQLRGLETKYNGFYTLGDFYLGQNIKESNEYLTVIDTVFKDDAWAKEKEEGVDSTDQYIVDYELYSTYKDLRRGYQLTWHNTGELYQIELVFY